MSLPLTQITQELLNYKYWLLFPIAIIEGPIITILAGFMASVGQLNLAIAYLVVASGDLTGDCFYYALGRFGKDTFIKRWGRFIGITESRVLAIEHHFDEHSGKTLITGKFAHGIGAAFLVAAGIAKMPFGKYFWFSLFSTLVKSLILILIGYYFGFAATKIKTVLDLIAAIVIGLTLAGFITYLFLHRDQKN